MLTLPFMSLVKLHSPDIILIILLSPEFCILYEPSHRELFSSYGGQGTLSEPGEDIVQTFIAWWGFGTCTRLTWKLLNTLPPTLRSPLIHNAANVTFGITQSVFTQ